MEKFIGDLNEYLAPLWKTKKIVNETVMFVGETDVAELLFTPVNVLSVKDYGLNVTYEKGKDYEITGKKIKRLKGFGIPYFTKEEYYPTTYETFAIGVADAINEEFGEQRYLKFGEGNMFTDRQIAISYETEDEWTGEVPEGKSDKFKRALKKLNGQEKLKFLFYGDSITTGCNASGTDMGGNVSPYAPPFDKAVCEYLKRKYGADVERINTAVGGMNTKWGVDNLDERVIKYNPDITLIAFGMNDPATTHEEYTAMISDMIERIKSANKNAEILLVSSILPNPNADKNWFANQRFFYEDLLRLERKYDFVGTADVTSIHKYILSQGKRYGDMTGNNINHPNDFMIRVYAQTILKTLLGDEFDL